uniref:Protein FAR1-RELATED SEQUENCE 11 n=1 Tax=Anthurium amnicola TaxID=1678845 RepID=A0A1D1YAP4_9ARAE
MAQLLTADMEHGKTMAICQYGGEFASNSDGSLTYAGGEAHIIDIDHGMLFDDLKSEIASLFSIDISTMSIKYFLPNNKRTLITVSGDKDLKRMVNFYANSETLDVYVLNKANNRETRNTIEDSGTSIAPADRNVRQRKRASVGKNGNRAAGTRINVADGAFTAAIGAASENGRKRLITTVERLNSGSTATDCSATIITTPTSVAVAVRQPPADNNECDYNREIGSIISDLGVSVTSSVVPYSPNDDVMYIGQEFDNVKVFRDELCKYAFLKGFKYKFIKNEHARLTAKCAEENCPWRIHASQSSRKKTFVVKKIDNAHTCKLGCTKDRRATPQWLASIIKDKLRESPHLRPKDIVADLFRDYGISLNYHQAWRGKELAQKELFTLHEEACNQLPWFCQQIIETNPGSVAMLAATADSKFRRVFVSFHASLHGFEHGCRPILFLDKIPLKTNLQWKLLAAAAVDADDGIFPVAFAAVESETYDSWLWFLLQLKYAVTTSHAITFVTHKQKGLEEVVPHVFEDSFHSYCLNQLMEDFLVELKKGMWSEKTKDALIDDFKNAAYSCNVEDFNVHIESIRSVSKDVADWVIASKPEHWSNALFKGQRYDHYSPQIVKSFGSWIPVKHESSVVLILDALREKLMEVMHARQDSSKTWEDILTPVMEEKLKKEIPKAAHYVVCSSDTLFEVRWNSVNVVNIGTWECTCRRWQMTGLPCTHALTVFDRIGKNMYDYCSRYFTTEMYRITYSEPIHPIPDVERISSIFKNSYPPRTNRPPDRPRRKRINPNKTTIRPLRCSRCKMVGHNKATCEAFL